MTEKTTHIACGSASPQCKCNCDADRDPKTFDHVCQHEWDGWEEFTTPEGGGGGEAICSRCGMGAMHHMLMAGF